MQVLGMIGKMLSRFSISTSYNTVTTQKEPINTMIVVKELIDNLKVLTEDPMSIFVSKVDLFGSPIPKTFMETLLLPLQMNIYFEKL